MSIQVVVDFFEALPVITKAFVTVIALLTVWLALLRFNNFATEYGPTILTMVGIFGCFLGIAIGLTDFDPAHVQESLPALVFGIKTSFWASVAGIFGALVIKFRLMIFGPPRTKTTGPIAGATIDDLANLLSRLQYSLAGQEDTTLLSQVKLMRQESRDGLTSLKTSFDAFLQTAAENNSKALIQALQQVIRDFNAKINEQFGENFKQLNSAVERVLVWQEKYRQQMQEMITQQQTCTASMGVAASRYEQLVSESKVFTEVASSLRSLLQGLDTQRTQLQVSLESLAKLVVSASEGLPKIEQQVLEMVRQIEAGVQTNSEAWSTAVKGLNQSLSDTVRTANDNLNTHVRQMSEQTKQQILALDRALSEELTKSLESLGRQLTALSQRFVDDYTPLTNRLRELIHAAGGV